MAHGQAQHVVVAVAGGDASRPQGVDEVGEHGLEALETLGIELAELLAVSP